MSTENLVTVKADALRWVEDGFAFYKPNSSFEMELTNKRKQIPVLSETYPDGIRVNPTDYTAAVIERIRQMLAGELVQFKKFNDVEYGLEATIKDYKGERIICVKSDPWPWQETGEWRVHDTSTIQAAYSMHIVGVLENIIMR
jgi:hypothetical protein